MRKMILLALALSGTWACSGGNFEKAVVTSDSLPDQSENATVQVIESPSTPSEAAVPIATNADSQAIETTKTELPKGPIFAECANEPDRPIVAELYQLPPNTQKLPDYSQLKSIKKICLSQLDIVSRKFSEGFPGVQNLFEWFSLDMKFQVKIPSAGLWSFKLISDDGAILYIADQKVIDNDGLHPVLEKLGTADLKAGLHNFHVSYYQGPRFDIALELMWKGPNDKDYTYIPKANLLRPGSIQLTGSLDD